MPAYGLLIRAWCWEEASTDSKTSLDEGSLEHGTPALWVRALAAWLKDVKNHHYILCPAETHLRAKKITNVPQMSLTYMGNCSSGT